MLHDMLEAVQLAASRVRERADGTPDAILVSRTIAAAANDLRTLNIAIRHQIVLGQGEALGRNLFRVLDDPLWQGPGRVIVGASVADDLHPLLAAALTELCGWLAGNHQRLWVQAKGDLRRPETADAAATHLCRWILAQARAGAGDEPSITPGQLQQFLTSGGHSAGAIERLVDATHSGGRCDDIIEVGAGVGLTSWLLAADERRAVRRVMLVDPMRRHELAAQQLWGSFVAGRDDRRALLARIPSYRYPFEEPADIILLCQTVFTVPREQREAFFARCWNALRPGGIVIVNEVVVDDVAPPDPGARRGAPGRNELAALLAPLGEPCLYREVSGWRRAEDPLSVPAREYYSSSFIVLRRD